MSELLLHRRAGFRPRTDQPQIAWLIPTRQADRNVRPPFFRD
jgi:hypothetical protein